MFDTGGIIALSLFKKRRTMDYAIRKFHSLSERAFSPRGLLKVSVLKPAMSLFYSFLYTSEGIETALKKEFGSEPLFGTPGNLAQRGDEFEGGDRVKVGVVTNVPGERWPRLLANYSRAPTRSMFPKSLKDYR